MDKNAKNNKEKSFPSVGINWYPGHMAKTKKQIIEDLKLVDVVVEILDARIPISSQNPDIKEYTKNKNKVIILNKSDLSDEKQNKAWVEHFAKNNITAILVNSNSGSGIQETIRAIEKATKEEKQLQLNKGRIGKSIRVMVVGIPNVGKSSFINRISNKTSAIVGNKPGVTKQKQWINVTSGIQLLDTPGVLWPKFKNNEIALNLAYTGTIKDDIIDKVEISYNLIKFLIENYRENIVQRYKLSNDEIEEILNNKNQMENENILEIMHLIGKKRGTIVSGGNVDNEKVSNIILEDFRTGKLGRITIEKIQ